MFNKPTVIKISTYLLTALLSCFAGVLTGQTYQLTEDFSGGVPPTGCSIENPDNSETWEMTTTTQSDGSSGRVDRMDNFQYDAAGQEDRLVLPTYKLTRTVAPKFSFDVAYAPFSAANFERLHIEVSTDNGVTFSATAYDKEGADLATTGNQGNGWGPQMAGDWRGDTLDLTIYAGPSLLLRFVQTYGFGNGLFIDNVKVNSLTVLPVELVNFDGYAVDKFNLLTWTTAREENFSHYALERSSDGISDWEQLVAVAGAGDVERQWTYRYTDDQPLPIAYYRLRSVDLDASSAYSNVILSNTQRRPSLMFTLTPPTAASPSIYRSPSKKPPPSDCTISREDNSWKPSYPANIMNTRQSSGPGCTCW